MNLLMISGDRSILQGKKSAFWYMLQEFSQYWEQIDVICPYVSPAWLKKQEEEGGMKRGEALHGNVYFHASPRGLWYQPRWISKKGRALKKERDYHVMSVHEYPPFYNGLGAEALSRKTGIPYVMEVHHIVGYPRASSFIEWLGKILSRLFLPNDTYGAVAVRCVNGEVATVLQKWRGPPDNIFVVPSFYLDSATLHHDDSIQKTYDVVCCGRLVANKRVKDIITAVSLLPEVTLCVVGDGPERKALEKRVRKLKIADRVEFVGWLPESADVYRTIQSGKVFVMNSRSEGGPRVALEAMALGMPVVATKVGVMTDVIRDKDNGCFTTGRPRDLAQKIKALLEYPATREQYGLEARAILQKFERKNLIKRYAEFLQSSVPSK